MSWRTVKLGELYTAHNGLAKGRQFFGSGYPFLSFSTVFNNLFIPDTLPDLVMSSEKERRNFDIKKGDIFITRTSETIDELGMSCVALKDYPEATYNGFTKRLRPIDSSIIHPRFIGYYLRLPSFRAGFMAFSTMTTRASLRNEDLLSMEIMLPDLATQQKIAGILSAYDDLIENNQKQIQLLEEAAQRLYKEWFVDLRFPGHESTRIVDGVPEGWERRKIDDICDIVGGATPSTKIKENYEGGNILWATPTDITKNKDIVLLDTEKKITQQGLRSCAAKILPPYTILMTSRASIGFFAVCEKELCTNQGFISCIPHKNYMTFYLLYNLISRKEEIISKSKGSTFLEISKSTFKNFEIIEPDMGTLYKFYSIIFPFIKKIEVTKNSIRHIEKTKNILLPKLISHK